MFSENLCYQRLDISWLFMSDCHSEDDSQDSPVPRSQENKAKSPKFPLLTERFMEVRFATWCFGLCHGDLFDYWLSWLDIWTFFIDIWCHHVMMSPIVTCFFCEVAGWCDRYEQIGTWSCHVFGALTLELQCVTLRVDVQSQSCQVVHLALHWFRSERCA